MIPYFPKQISYRGIFVYLIALILISVYYYSYAMSFLFIAIGIIWVFGFFLLTRFLSKEWQHLNKSNFIESLFIVAIVLRLAWVIASYFILNFTNGNPFEINAADSITYHRGAEWLSEYSWRQIFRHYYNDAQMYGISDIGYPFYLTVVYKILGPNVLLARIIKAFASAFTCVLIYKLSSRTFGDSIARIAGIMAVLMPNLIIYCGYHLKETEMIFLEVAFLERLDYLFRSNRISLGDIILTTILAGSLFFFRTAMGTASLFCTATTLLLYSSPAMKKGWRRVALIGWGVLCIFLLGGGKIATDVEEMWEDKDMNQRYKREEQVSRGYQWSDYATGTVMAPLAIVLPFATMVNIDLDQQNQLVKSGGNYIRNFMGFFALIAIYEAIRRRKWKNYSLIGSFTIAYLGVVAFSGFSNSERFLLPGLPCLIMMWAYGIAMLREKTYRFLTPWCVIVFLMEFGWSFFKLGSRSLL